MKYIFSEGGGFLRIIAIALISFSSIIFLPVEMSSGRIISNFNPLNGHYLYPQLLRNADSERVDSGLPKSIDKIFNRKFPDSD